MARYDYPVSTKEIIDQSGDNSLVIYYLTAQQSKLNHAEVLYGIRVVKMARGTLIKEEITPPISYSYKLVRQMLDLLIKHRIAPMAVLETVDDMVSTGTVYDI